MRPPDANSFARPPFRIDSFPVSTSRRHLLRYAWLSLGTAVVTIALKLLAWKLTGSVGLLSDALESLVNLAAAAAALGAILISALPPDDEHAFGHDKIEFFSSGFEGALILGAASAILWTAISRFSNPVEIHQFGPGIAVSAFASTLNLIVGRLLISKGRAAHSPALEADGHHLMTDVWTSGGVLAGMLLVWVTGWTWLDPIIALGVALFIIRMGFHLVRTSVHGLLDRALAPESLQAIKEVLRRYESGHIHFHALRTRASGSRQFVAVHVLVPDEWTVRQGHDLLEKIEAELRAILPAGNIFTHLEPLNDPASWDDELLDR
jgi:cation diffusion facilitator family transporter